MAKELVIGVVGPCAAGKTTLIIGLNLAGYSGKHIAQEHSYVQDMWLRMTDPDVLIYLNVSYEKTLIRRKLNWTENEYLKQVVRLRHARSHADLCIDTGSLSPDQVLTEVISFLVNNATNHTTQTH